MENSKEITDEIMQEAKKSFAKAQERVKNPDDVFFLAGCLPFDEDEPCQYTPKAWRGLPPEKQARFELVGYSRADVKAYREAVDKEEADPIEEMVRILRSSGCVGWQNLLTRKGKAIEVGDKSFLERAQEALIVELHQMCWAFATGLVPAEAEGLG